MARQAGGPYGRGTFRFTEYARGLTDAHARAAERSAEWAEAEAKRRCPVDTGALRDSIGTDVRSTAQSIALVLFAAMHYALYVEFGTARMAAQPYLRPTLDLLGRQHGAHLAQEVTGVAA